MVQSVLARVSGGLIALTLRLNVKYSVCTFGFARAYSRSAVDFPAPATAVIRIRSPAASLVVKIDWSAEHIRRRRAYLLLSPRDAAVPRVEGAGAGLVHARAAEDRAVAAQVQRCDRCAGETSGEAPGDEHRTEASRARCQWAAPPTRRKVVVEGAVHQN